MAEQDKEQEKAAEDVAKDVDNDDEDSPNYKPPAPKALDEIVNADAEDESLRKYKEALLGTGVGEKVIIDDAKSCVIVERLALHFTDRDPMFLDLKKPAEELKKSSFTLKEGVIYKIAITFRVQKEIVSGLKYQHKVYRKGIAVDKMTQMMGSYGPKWDEQTFTTSQEEAPHGLLSRGEYKIKSRFVDDDDVEHAKWEWILSIKKDW